MGDGADRVADNDTMNVKSLVPPAAWSGVERNLRWGRLLRMVPVVTWTDAVEQSTGYEAVTAETEEPLASRATPGIELSAREQQVLAAFGIALARIPNRRAVRVLDIGGGPGSYGRRVIKEFPARDIEWTVLETPAACSRFGSGRTAGIRWTSDPSVVSTGFDIVLASAVINYVPEPYELLDRAAAAAPFVIVNRLPLWPFRRDVPAVQKVSRRRDLGSYPTWFFSERRFRDAVADVGEVVCEWEVPQDSTIVFGIRRNYRGMLIDTRSR